MWWFVVGLVALSGLGLPDLLPCLLHALLCRVRTPADLEPAPRHRETRCPGPAGTPIQRALAWPRAA